MQGVWKYIKKERKKEEKEVLKKERKKMRGERCIQNTRAYKQRFIHIL